MKLLALLTMSVLLINKIASAEECQVKGSGKANRCRARLNCSCGPTPTSVFAAHGASASMEVSNTRATTATPVAATASYHCHTSDEHRPGSSRPNGNHCHSSDEADQVAPASIVTPAPRTTSNPNILPTNCGRYLNDKFMNAYTHFGNVMIYTGREERVQGKGLAHRVVHELTNHINFSNVCVFMGNFYSSQDLFTSLLNVDI
ncbi:hypothetical protein MAR_036141 [Mya arenaria]|uniref:Uncharacterized protein n=1 Tax=Mya arenaria TaxID=6604 RepID=A0ABY7EPA1_MYAAR|nr:hypothetical protein MAR_036141 [Mya arenaria]